MSCTCEICEHCYEELYRYKKLRNKTSSLPTKKVKVKVKVKESRNRPGVAQGVPGGLGVQIS
jgi:hypothetical protein